MSDLENLRKILKLLEETNEITFELSREIFGRLDFHNELQVLINRTKRCLAKIEETRFLDLIIASDGDNEWEAK